MPVTIRVTSHPARELDPTVLTELLEGYGSSSSAKKEPGWRTARLLQLTAPNASQHLQHVLQSTVTDETASKILPHQNGLVHTCLEAYNHHRHLVLRPDDVWIAIVTQFSFYINKHAEELRSHFVAHEGKKELVVKQDILKSGGEANFAHMTAMMADLIQVCDPETKHLEGGLQIRPARELSVWFCRRMSWTRTSRLGLSRIFQPPHRSTQ